jgi:hypothetical protein
MAPPPHLVQNFTRHGGVVTVKREATKMEAVAADASSAERSRATLVG